MSDKQTFATMSLVGEARFVHVNSSVSTFEGKEQGYSMNLVLDKKSIEELKRVATEILTNAQEDEGWTNFKGNKVAKGKWMPIELLVNQLIRERENENGVEEYVVLKAPHMVKDKRVYIPMFDKHGAISEEKAREKQIPYGSKVCVEFTMYVYFVNQGMQGVKTKIRAIQILEEAKMGAEKGSSFTFVPPTPSVPI